jgi:hypothetical protein
VADPQSAAHFHPAEPGMRCAKPGKPQASPHKKEPPGTFPSGSRQMAVSGSAPIVRSFAVETARSYCDSTWRACHTLRCSQALSRKLAI